VYFMKLKSAAPGKFKEYVARVDKQHSQSKVCRFSVAGGGEYGCREKFLDYLEQEGIRREVSAQYSEQQNGIAERCNRTVLDPARSMLKHGGMPNMLWAEAMATAVYIKNRLPTRALPNSTPYERWTRKKPALSHVHTCGWLAFVWIHGDLRKKLDDHAYNCPLLEYLAETLRQCRVMNISMGRVFMARDVTLDEFILYLQLISQPTKLLLESARELPNGEPAPPVEPPHQLLQAKPRPINSIDDSDDHLSPPPDRMEPDLMLNNLQSNQQSTAPASSSRTRSGRSTITMAMIIAPGPKTYGAALNSEDADQWKEATGKEVSSMKSHGVFTFVERPPGDASMIESCWVMGRKLLGNAQTEKWKVRLVGHGDQHMPAD
jgi:hypothetical protein